MSCNLTEATGHRMWSNTRGHRKPASRRLGASGFWSSRLGVQGRYPPKQPYLRAVRVMAAAAVTSRLAAPASIFVAGLCRLFTSAQYSKILGPSHQSL